MRSPTLSSGALFTAFVALFVGLLGFTPAAQAAPGTISLQTSAATAIVGESVTLTWSTTDATGLVASGDWSGPRPDSGDEIVTVTTVGTSTFTLTGADSVSGDPVTVSVTVEVLEAPAVPVPPTEVTPDAVVLDADCTVVVPEQEGVSYSVTIDGLTEVVAAGSYDSLDFLPEGSTPVAFTAEAAPGFVLSPGAVVEWTFSDDELLDCFDFSLEKALTIRTTCGAVSFTNVSDIDILVVYGSFDNADPDGEEWVPAGGTRTVETTRTEFDFMAIDEDDFLRQIDFLTVPQGCADDEETVTETVAGTGKPWPARPPSVAPAAGASRGGGSPIGVLALLTALALMVARRQLGTSH